MKLLNNTQSWRSLLSKCGVDKQMFLSDVYKKRTQAKKHQLDAPQFGRSMVEMLGVLAIIGVLSVGGIAGYSKAMFKYKINKTIDVMSYAIARIIELENTPNKQGQYLINSARDARILGVIPDCDENYVSYRGSPGMYCQLPLGEVEFSEIMYGYNLANGTFMGSINIAFTENQVESCVTFLTSKIYLNMPKHWYNSGAIRIFTPNSRSEKYLYGNEDALSNDISLISNADIADA